MRSQRVVWLANGLSDELTGIERSVCHLARQLVDEGIAVPDDIAVYVDTRAQWWHELRDLGLDVRPLALGRLQRRIGRPSQLRGPRPLVLHNFGAMLFPRDTARMLTIYSIYDWGPFRDRAMPMRSRLIWSRFMWHGVRRADVVHFISDALPGGLPPMVPRPRRTVVSYPGTTLEMKSLTARRAGVVHDYALFVGTVNARKRVELLAHSATEYGFKLVLAGAGTEAFDAPPWVRGLGRVTDEELGGLYAGAGVLLLVSSYEGFGIPVLEAAAIGCPSVVSAEVAAVVPHQLKPYVEVVDPHDSRQVGEVVTELLASDPRPPLAAGELSGELLRVYADALGPGNSRE